MNEFEWNGKHTWSPVGTKALNALPRPVEKVHEVEKKEEEERKPNAPEDQACKASHVS